MLFFAKGASRSNKNLGSSRGCPKCEAKIVVPTVGLDHDKKNLDQVPCCFFTHAGNRGWR